MAAQQKKRRLVPVAHSAMSERLLKLAAETGTPEPYEVTDDLVIDPPTRTRSKAMHAAEVTLYLLNGMLQGAMNRAALPEPQPPTSVAGESTDVEDALEYARATGEYVAAHAEWETATKDVESEVAQINEKIGAAQTDYERAFFGDAYDDVIEFFEDKPLLWGAFVEDIRAEFLPPVPDNGICPKCGHVDEEAAGKVQTSST